METLNYHHLQYFWTVCHEGGFTKASTKLRLSQSAVSEQVARLEDSFGQKLITRTTRSFELTEAGQMAFKYAETIFGTGRELMDAMKHRPSTRQQLIRVGALGSLSRNLQARFLSPLLGREDVQFSVTVGDSRRLLRLLSDHEIDIILSTYPATEVGASQLYTHLLTESPLCIVTARSAARDKRRLEIAELLGAHRVFLPSRALESRTELDHFVESRGLSLRISGEIDDVALLRVLALTGDGIVIVPRVGVNDDIKNRSLVVLHEFKKIRQRFYAITRQKKIPNPIISELVRPLR